jgi:hypothetical protein
MLKIFLIFILNPFFMAQASSSCDSSQGHVPADVSATTSIYYTPTMSTETVRCGSQVLNAIVDYKGRTIRNCSRILALLNEEGAATVRDSRGQYQSTYVFRSSNLFKKTSSPTCPMGYGNRDNICLNPFKTLAAHMGAGYRTGDTIYIPQTVNMKYPLYPNQPESEWAIHDGYWVIGDSGSKIRGRGRFDFFSGSMDWRDPKNPLTRIGFGDAKNIPFCRVTAARAEAVKNNLGYPGLNSSTQVALLTNAATPQADPIQTATLETPIESPAPVSPSTPNAESAQVIPVQWSSGNNNNIWVDDLTTI